MSVFFYNKKIDLNNMNDININNNTEMNLVKNTVTLSQLSKTQLFARCEEIGITKYKSKNKDQLIELINSKSSPLKTEDENVIISEIENVVIGESENVVIGENNKYNLLECINTLLQTNTLKELAEKLNIATGTITRWIELNDIPKNYDFDILKLSNIPIDYSKYSSKEKDQLFTPFETAQKCFQIFTDVLKLYSETPADFKYIEPSAGDGSFLKVLPADTISLDIEPRHPSIKNCDYLNWTPTETHNYVVFGNPPFGLRGHLALKFINHSYKFADYVCFILPQLFESDGKGVPRKRVKGYNLIYSIKLDSNFYEPNGNIIKINTIFQIWSKKHTNNLYDIKDYTNEKMKIYSMSDGGTVSSTRNKDMIGKCDIYIPSTCFGKENMKCYNNFEDLPGKKGYGIVFAENKSAMINKMVNIEWNKISFLSTNSAYNLRSSQIYELFNL